MTLGFATLGRSCPSFLVFSLVGFLLLLEGVLEHGHELLKEKQNK